MVTFWVGEVPDESFLLRLTLLIQTYDYVSSLNEEVMRLVIQINFFRT